MKDIKDLTFDEVVDHAKQEILLDLMVGKYESGVRRMMALAIRWAEIHTIER